jgi:hypothetical protein
VTLLVLLLTITLRMVAYYHGFRLNGKATSYMKKALLKSYLEDWQYTPAGVKQLGLYAIGCEPQVVVQDVSCSSLFNQSPLPSKREN